ncbi:MAG: AMP-binding protein [SAR324 cluster bacterium]|nr:AMP-binding protein [SAR324 cluster bacterium]
MSIDFQKISAEMEVIEQEDGSVILQNKVPISSYPANLCSWLHHNAEMFPERAFLMQREKSGEWAGLTFAQASKKVDLLSNGLLAKNLDPLRPIAILSENSVQMAVTQLAAMQIGLAVVPISFAYSVRSETGSHIKHILEVSQSAMLVMSDAKIHMPKLVQWDTGNLELYAFSNSESYPNVLPFESLFEQQKDFSIERQSRFDAVTSETLAKIQFTSGSTNLPKGVEVTHGMMTTNMVGVSQMWPFLEQNEVIIDWLPWNHTFGGNFVFNLMLMHGGTFYIDHGNPTPIGIETTVKNIIDVSPTLYFGVPRSYTALYARMKEDEQLKHAFFKNLKFIFTAAAALDQATFEGLRAMSSEVCGEVLPFLSGWGSTETAPDSTLIYWVIDDARVIGLPIPGVTIKLAPDPSGKKEIRVKGPNITRGYYNNQEASQTAFDSEGYYRTGDAGKFLDAENPSEGLVFDGRIGEDFKLTSGVWVHNSRLRNSINQLGQPFQLEVIIAAPNREYLAALVFPNLPALRNRFAEADKSHPDDGGFLADKGVVEFFKEIFKKHNLLEKGSSGQIKRFTLLTIPPRIDKNETTDKGYVNQSAVLNHRADVVEALYAEFPAREVIVVD